MLHDTIIEQKFTRRSLLVGAGKSFLLSVLGARLYYLQVVDADEYKTMADGNRIRIYSSLPKRGRILDVNGEVLAEGSDNYQVIYEPNSGVDEALIAKEVARILEKDFNDEQKLLAKIKKHTSDEPLILDDYLDWDKVAKIEVNAIKIPGVGVSSNHVRHYPYAKETAHITGYIGKPSKNDINDNGALFNHPDFRVGKTGIEKQEEDILRGVAGLRHVEVDARGKIVRQLKEDPPITGDDVSLTIDVELQKYVMEKLSNKGGLVTEGGSAIVMDIATGAIKAMASVPSYDPNQFVRGIQQKYWDELINDPDSPLSNKAISLHYPPGSTFKLVTALAALEVGIITPETTHYCNGHYTFGGRKFHCWNRYGHGNVDMIKAIAVSCNVYFFTIATKVGVEKMASMARRLGLGSLTGIELPGEVAGLVPDKAWKRQALNQPWYGGETLNNAIGQGFLLATPIQLVTMAARLANGKQLSPYIIQEGESDFDDLDINPYHLHYIRQGMDDVANRNYGGSYHARIKDSGFEMAGKTGTAQVRSYRRYQHVPAERAARYHAIFVGYAPIQRPRYAVSVVIEHGGYGSAVAAPIARDILKKVQGLEV